METIKVTLSALNKNKMFVSDTSENFLKHNPPCKECLIQSMCIKDCHVVDEDGSIVNYMLIDWCYRMRNFIANDKHFFYIPEYVMK